MIGSTMHSSVCARRRHDARYRKGADGQRSGGYRYRPSQAGLAARAAILPGRPSAANSTAATARTAATALKHCPESSHRTCRRCTVSSDATPLLAVASFPVVLFLSKKFAVPRGMRVQLRDRRRRGSTSSPPRRFAWQPRTPATTATRSLRALPPLGRCGLALRSLVALPTPDHDPGKRAGHTSAEVRSRIKATSVPVSRAIDPTSLPLQRRRDRPRW